MAELYEKLEKLLGNKVEQKLNEMFFSLSNCTVHGKFVKQTVLELNQEFEVKSEAINQKKSLMDKCIIDVNALNSQYAIEKNRRLMKYEDILAKNCIIENGLVQSIYNSQIIQCERSELQLKAIYKKDVLEDRKKLMRNLIKDKENLLQEAEEIDKNLENFEHSNQVYLNEIQEFSRKIDDFKLKGQELDDKKVKLNADKAEYEKEIEKLRKDCEELKKELDWCEGVAGWEKKSEKCGICAQPELGRMKKCKGCLMVVHAKCTKEVKFVCVSCKNRK